jgi:branched-chain amino acid transport system ATP-binding protein
LEKNNVPLLEIKGLSVSYAHINAVRDVSLYVREKETVSLIGSNGAGKSTLLASVLGIQRPSAGTIRYRGEDITELETDRIVSSGISIVPEGRGIFPMMSVTENLLLGLFHVKSERHKNLERTFGQFPILSERREQLAGTLSGGQQQILSIARAIISQPKLLILDEPSLGLAPIMVEEMFSVIETLKKGGLTILLAEQNAWKALECAERAYVFETGKIVLEGNTKELEKDERIRHAYLDISD